MSPLEKINDPASEAEWAQAITEEFFRQAVRETARLMVQALPDAALLRIAGLVRLKSPPTMESVKALVPAQGIKKPHLLALIASTEGVTISQARELLTNVVVQKGLKEFAIGREIMVGNPEMSMTDFDWSSVMKEGKPHKGTDVLKDVMQMTGKAKPTVYRMIQNAVASKVMESSRTGREQILMLPLVPVPVPEPCVPVTETESKPCVPVSVPPPPPPPLVRDYAPPPDRFSAMRAMLGG